MGFYHGPPTGEIRLRRPREGEIFGVVKELYGGSRMLVECQDGKSRMARVPGKIRKGIWVRVGDVVLIRPWSVQGDEKCDIAYRYTRVQVESLKRNGILK